MVKFYSDDEIDEILRIIDDPGIFIPVKEETTIVVEYMRNQNEWLKNSIKKKKLRLEIIKIEENQIIIEKKIDDLHQKIEAIVGTIRKNEK